MRKPKETLLVFCFTIAVVVNAVPLKTKRESEKELPHSQDYYDGYIKALVDHYQEIFRNTRDITGDTASAVISKVTNENKVADSVVEVASKKDQLLNGNDDTSKSGSETVESTVQTTANQNNQNNTSSSIPYSNPENPTHPTPSDTELSESSTPDAHKKNEEKEPQAVSAINEQQGKARNGILSSDENKLPETMQDIKYFTAASTDLEDMKKRSSEDESDVDTKRENHPSADANTKNDKTAASDKRVADMESESKVISHSSSTYTPGNPFKNTPSTNNNQTPSPPAHSNPQLQKAYQKQKKSKKMTSKQDDEDILEGSQFKTEPKYFKVPMVRNGLVPILVVPVPVESMGWSSTGSRKNLLAKKDEDSKDKDDDDDDDDEEKHELSYLVPLHGFPGWYEAGHGIPYGYNHDYGYHGYGFGHHGHVLHGHGHGHGHGHEVLLDNGVVWNGHGYGNGHDDWNGHPFGHGHGVWHGHGHGHGHHDMVLDNGVVWPYEGSYLHTPCGCGGNNAFFPLPNHSLPGIFA